MQILCCNIRCSGADDGKNSWSHRQDLCIEVIRARAPQIICFQEMWKDQFDDLRAAFREFDWHAMIDEPDGNRPMNTIFYARQAFTRLAAGGYWLSETPHIPGSKSWGAAWTRLANWLRLVENGTGKEFRIINTHLDYKNEPLQGHQAELINQDAAAYPTSYPQILTGDMNGDAQNLGIVTLKAGGWRDTYALIHGIENPGPSYHGLLGDKCVYPPGKIDWIFVRGSIQTLDAGIVRDSRDGRYPSDHYFVSAQIEL